MPSTAVPDQNANPVVVVSGQRYDSRRDTAARITINQATIAQYGDSNIGEVLSRVPGITVETTSITGNKDIRLSGLGTGYTQLLLNGERVPENFSFGSIPPDQVERIEIHRSPTANVSANAIAGSINVILKRVSRVPKSTVKFGLGTSSSLSNPNIGATMAGTVDTLGYSFSLNAQGRDSSSTFPVREQQSRDPGSILGESVGEETHKTRALATDVSATLQWKVGTAATITSETYFTSNQQRYRGHATFVTQTSPIVPYDVRNTSQDLHDRFVRTDLHWEQRMSDGPVVNLAIKTSRNSRRPDWKDAAYFGDTLRYGSHVEGRNVERSTALSGKIAFPQNANDSFSMGWEVTHSERNERRIDGPLLPGAALGPISTYSAQKRALAAYVQHEVTFSRALAAYFGLRYEREVSTIQSPGFKNNRHHDQVVAPSVQMLHKFLNGSDQVRMAVGRTYKPPALASLLPQVYRSAHNTAVDPDGRGNPGLKAETARSVDIAFERYLHGKTFLSISASRRWIANYTMEALQLEGGRWTSSPANAGNAAATSLTFEAKDRFDVSPPYGKSIEAALALTRHQSRVADIAGPYNRVAAQPPLTVNFALDYKIDESTQAGLSFNFKSGMEAQLNQTISIKQTATRRLDTYLSTLIGRRLRLRLSMLNLLNNDVARVKRFKAGTEERRRYSIDPAYREVRINLELPL